MSREIYGGGFCAAGESTNRDDVKKFADFVAAIHEAAENFGAELVIAFISANAYQDANDDREEVLNNVIQKIIDDANVTMSVINNNITRLS